MFSSDSEYFISQVLITLQYLKKKKKEEKAAYPMLNLGKSQRALKQCPHSKSEFSSQISQLIILSSLPDNSLAFVTQNFIHKMQCKAVEQALSEPILLLPHFKDLQKLGLHFTISKETHYL